MGSVKADSRPANRHVDNGMARSESRNLQGLPKSLDKDVYGKRLLPIVANELARTNPNHVHASIAISSDLSQGFRDVTTSQMVNAADHMAWKMNELFGRSDSFEVVSYFGLSDVRYSIMVLALIKTGYVVSISALKLKRALTMYSFRPWSPPFATRYL